jgi:RimJ/RimL family protein N-acetyltransferase
MLITQTPRLLLRELTAEDAPFIFQLLNEPSWLQFIGDKGVRTIEDAVQYILNGPVKSYAANGFGLWLVVLKEGNTPIGMCGLIKRPTLEDIDIGFAYLPEYVGQGYAYEAAAATLEYAKHTLSLKRILAITNPDNNRSIRLLEKLGLQFKQLLTLPGEGTSVVLMSGAL